MLKYDKMAVKVFTHVRRPDGYFGDTVVVGLAFHDKKLIEVHESGYHVSGFLPMDIAGMAEVRWLLENHPNAKKYYQTSKLFDYKNLEVEPA